MKTMKNSSTLSIMKKSLWVSRVPGSYMIVCVAIILWLSPGVYAQQSESAKTTERNHDIISNQSVSIDLRPLVQQDSQNHQEVLPAKIQNPTDKDKTENMSPADETSTSTNTEPVTVLPARRIPKRLTGVASNEPSTLSPSVPWYRTGLGALAIVMCVMGGLYWVIRRWVPSVRTSDNRVVRVVARTAITPKHHAALLRIGQRFVLVGISGDKINTLSEITNPQEVADLTARVDTTQSSHATGFENLLSKETADYTESKPDLNMETISADDDHRSHRQGWLKTPALSELKNKLRLLQHR